MNYTIYGKPQCPNCDIAKNLLKSKNIDFEYKDISKNQEDLLFLKNLGAKSVPVVFIQGQLLGGLNELKRALDELFDNP